MSFRGVIVDGLPAPMRMITLQQLHVAIPLSIRSPPQQNPQVIPSLKLIWHLKRMHLRKQSTLTINLFRCHNVDGSDIQLSSLKLVVYPIIYQGSSTIQKVVGLGISEPSTVGISGWIPKRPPRRDCINSSQSLVPHHPPV